MKEPRYIEALYALAGKNCIGGNADGPISEITFVEDYTPPTEANIQTKLTELQAEYDAQAYSRNRQADYPDWGTQLNKIYDDGVTKWKSEMVDPVKAKWPKDNSGPVE